jgi:hypothetical protein
MSKSLASTLATKNDYIRMATGRATDEANVFTVTGWGGLPENPTQRWNDPIVGRDLRPAIPERSRPESD